MCKAFEDANRVQRVLLELGSKCLLQAIPADTAQRRPAEVREKGEDAGPSPETGY